jgi:AbrB family looped-hinge helix DNA binding protein
MHGADFWQIKGTTTVGERGQVVIPAAVRADLGISGGEQMVVFAEKEHGAVIIVKAEVVNRISQMFLAKFTAFSAETQKLLDDLNIDKIANAPNASATAATAASVDAAFVPSTPAATAASADDSE